MHRLSKKISLLEITLVLGLLGANISKHKTFLYLLPASISKPVLATPVVSRLSPGVHWCLNLVLVGSGISIIARPLARREVWRITPKGA